MSGVREPAVAGQFYEAERGRLTASLRECFQHPLGPGSLPAVAEKGPGLVSALVSPHAGYMFSGPAAACAYHALAADGAPEVAIILGPSHHAGGRRAAVSLAEAWRTPLGLVPVAVELGQELIAACELLEADEQVHRLEHSLEVQVPFLQFVYGERAPRICPICVRSHPFGSLSQAVADARAIGETIARIAGKRKLVVIASTDLSHHIPHERAQRQDRMALEAILAFDPERLLRTVVEHDISMCGPMPVAIALHWSLALGGEPRASLLRYYTSGDVISDRRAVVGYASVVVSQRGG